MEIIIALVIIGVGLIWYYNAKNKEVVKETAPEPVKPTVNAADLSQPLVITPSLNPMQSLPVSVVTEPIKGPAVEEAKPAKKAPAKKAAAAKKAPAKKTAAKKTPVRKSGGKKVG